MQMIKDYIDNISERHPGLVLYMLDILDDITNYADNPPEYVVRAQDIYLGQTFLSNLEHLRSFMRYIFIFRNPGFGADLRFCYEGSHCQNCGWCCAALNQS